jgi:hypothetical protein
MTVTFIIGQCLQVNGSLGTPARGTLDSYLLCTAAELRLEQVMKEKTALLS